MIRTSSLVTRAMKTLRDTNNNNSNATQNYASSMISSTSADRHHGLTPSAPVFQMGDSDCTSDQRLGHTSSINSSKNIPPHVSPLPDIQSAVNLLASLSNGDPSQLSTAIQSYLLTSQKHGGSAIFQPETINPLLYLQLINGNAALMQQLATAQHPFPSSHSSASQILHAETNAFVPQARSMTHDEVAEHAQSVYHRALQRNHLQQQSDLVTHLYDTLNFTQPDSIAGIYPTHEQTMSSQYAQEFGVPSVPSANEIGRTTSRFGSAFHLLLCSVSGHIRRTRFHHHAQHLSVVVSVNERIGRRGCTVVVVASLRR